MGVCLEGGEHGGYSLAQIKTMEGPEGLAVSAILVHNEEPVARVFNKGDGGGTMATCWGNREAYDGFTTFVRTLPGRRVELEEQTIEDDETGESFLDHLVIDALWEQEVVRTAATETMFILPDDGPDGCRSINKPYSPEVRAELIEKYGQEVRILNEMLA